eukprot:3334156-Rhodomonas_salina.1
MRLRVLHFAVWEHSNAMYFTATGHLAYAMPCPVLALAIRVGLPPRAICHVRGSPSGVLVQAAVRRMLDQSAYADHLR